MKKSVTPEHVLKNLDKTIDVWEDNPDFTMGPEVTLDKVKATRDKLDKCIKNVAKTATLQTKQTDDRDDCAKTGNQYVVRSRKAILGFFGPDSTQYAQAGGTRASEHKKRGPKSKTGTKAA